MNLGTLRGSNCNYKIKFFLNTPILLISFLPLQIPVNPQLYFVTHLHSIAFRFGCGISQCHCPYIFLRHGQ
jgi:hypothetical protein